MDLLLRYFDEVDYKVEVRYYDSHFFGHGTLKDIQKQFNNTVSDLDHSKLFQVEMDGPNVNLKFLPQHGLLSTLDHVAFILYIIHSKLEPNKMTGKWKRFSKHPIKYFVTLQREVKLLSLVPISFTHNSVQQGWWIFSMIYLFIYSTNILCVRKFCALKSKFWCFVVLMFFFFDEVLLWGTSIFFFFFFIYGYCKEVSVHLSIKNWVILKF